MMENDEKTSTSEQYRPRKRFADRRKNRLEHRKKRSWLAWVWFLLTKPGLIRRSKIDRRASGEQRSDWVRCGRWVSIYAPSD